MSHLRVWVGESGDLYFGGVINSVPADQQGVPAGMYESRLAAEICELLRQAFRVAGEIEASQAKPMEEHSGGPDDADADPGNR